MIDKRRKIWFIIISLIVIISIFMALYSNQQERKTSRNVNNNANITSNTVNPTNNAVTNQNTEVINEITVGNSSYKNEQVAPDVTGLSDEVKQKIETYLNNYYKEVWKELGAEFSEDELTKMLEQQNSNEYGNVGFKQSFEQVFINNKVVSYSYNFVGSLGGAPWEKTDGLTFDVNTGELIKIEDIVTSKEKYIQVCKKYVYEQLRLDSRYSMLVQGYDKVVDSHIEKLEGYITKDGIVCVIIQKYEIADGAAGEFIYTIPFDTIKTYINSDYVF